MGLNRCFNLCFQHPDREPLDDEAYIQRIIDEMEAVTGYSWNEGMDGGVSADGINWYDWSEDMETISEEFPDVLFFLHCDGMGINDTWEAGFLNGRSDIQYAEIPELDYQYLRRDIKTK